MRRRTQHAVSLLVQFFAVGGVLEFVSKNIGGIIMFVVNRDAHHSNYTCIANAVLRDTRLSLAARGFMAVVLSLPDD